MNLNFKEQFVGAILSGKKIHTLQYGERWKDGDKIHFYTGLGTKKSKLFAKGVVVDIYGSFDWQPEIERFKVDPVVGQAYIKNILGGLWTAEPFEFWYLFAKNDGFKDFAEMADFFKKNGKEGKYQLIVWGALDEKNL